ncbi:hypothetical protein OHC33_002203 [Knufia fluminis]|uniref:BZIP domain-containing protein n=1 Tax=Knufia fluminis TaxID=191047 RepID=A0AAN8EYP4_9EURO|nr:hypothetical protein OHC33_002203 [Knufia fluminis]
MARIAHREICSDDEDWAQIDDQVERRKAQNRNNQRAYRRRKYQLLQAEKGMIKARKSTKPVLLPKLPAIEYQRLSKQQLEGGPGSACEAQTPSPRPFSVHDVVGTGLDGESRRIFYYASNCLWTTFSQQVIETNEPLAAAMSRLSISSELTMQTFLWTAAIELEMHSSFPANREVMLKQQNRAIARIQRDLASNCISDELIFAVYALVASASPAGIFSEREILLCRHWSPYGDFHPPLASLGWMDYMSQFRFDDRHAEAAVKLLEPKGGLWGMEVVEFAYQMQAVDLLRNSSTGSKPSFNLCRSYRHILDLQMPLYRAVGAFLDWPISPEFTDLFLDLRCFLRQVDLYMTKAQPIVPPETLVAWRNINQHRVLSLPPDRDQMFRLGVLIFSYNVTFPVPYRDPVQQWVRELIPYMHKAPAASEAVLWVVVVAAMSSPDEEVLNCLLDKARRVKTSLSLDTWFDVRTIMNRYLWLESACDMGGERFWRHVCREGKLAEVHDHRKCGLIEGIWTAFT